MQVISVFVNPIDFVMHDYSTVKCARHTQGIQMIIKFALHI